MLINTVTPKDLTILENEKYTFSAGSPVQTGWTIYSGSFAQGAAGSEWITAGQSSTNCLMYRSISLGNNFKMQHRCIASRKSYGGIMMCSLSDIYSSPMNTGFYYALSSSGGDTSAFIINGVVIGNRFDVVDGTTYIDEIVFDGTNYTLTLYLDNNGETGTVVATETTAGTNNNLYLILKHEHATSPYSQTEWIKIWYS